jgi:hypothetical protein
MTPSSTCRAGPRPRRRPRPPLCCHRYGRRAVPIEAGGRHCIITITCRCRPRICPLLIVVRRPNPDTSSPAQLTPHCRRLTRLCDEGPPVKHGAIMHGLCSNTPLSAIRTAPASARLEHTYLVAYLQRTLTGGRELERRHRLAQVLPTNSSRWPWMYSWC